jgi:Xaa-Pro aminopeptidase
MDRKIEPGEVVALDAIGAYQGYQFDVNRTTVAGRPDDRTRQFLDITLAATDAGVAACVAGARVRDVVAASTAVFNKSPYSDLFGGSMGHGIGLETVELPYLSRDDTTELLPGMTLCVEPSLFVPGWAGAAIEQEVIIRDSGPPEVITVTPTRLW